MASENQKDVNRSTVVLQTSQEQFTSAPTQENLQMGPSEMQVIKDIVQWEKRSSQSLRVLGEPIY